MNKFIAVLRDSYREAVSTWVVPVMVAFTLLLVVLVASVGFRPITLQDELDNQFGTLNAVLRFNPALKSSQFAVENLAGTNDAEPWSADYAFDIVFRASPDAVKQFEGNPGFPLTRRRTENFVRGALPFLENVKATDASPPAPKADAPAGTLREYRFHVTSQGTKVKDRESWVHQPSFLFAFDYFFTYSLRDGVYKLEKRLVNDAGAWVTLFVSVVITAGFIPNMLRKGALDLYISKPIGRAELLVYKYFGGLIFVLMLTAVMVGAIWVTVGVRTGLWSPHFLALVPLLTFYFAVLYAVSTLAAVVTRSTLVAILATAVAWGVFFGVGFAHDAVTKLKTTAKEFREKAGAPDADPDDALEGGPGRRRAPWEVPTWVSVLADVAYYPAPRTYDLDDRMIRSIAQGVLTDYELKQNNLDTPLPSWAGTLGVSAAFIAACLGLASWRMAARDG